MIKMLGVVIVSLSAGVAVGGGFVAFITVLGIIPRMMQLTKTARKIVLYEAAVIFGAIFGSYVSLFEPQFSIPPIFLLAIGLCYGIFVGSLAAALTEVLNVFPILAKRIHLEEKIIYLIGAVVFGKICGSLFHWLYFITL
ncbi:stage V sporulation protein AB [Fervidibacillus halotolerans]|uniref:Stage V sporulation protein AB n=1 Tax=Fervidibacillus halotolerans TaxID=2980027 RepID=A0A9E8M1H5_9BACI|nr:stage V sporulation protein AB [Fervidibacillus halotolerans]WAA13813.1 stage V sporulation protein AB [Fervidibacillus halotolerans]